MAETLISPGVLARENDQSQITSQPIQAGAAIVGPTVLGKTSIPKLVTSYSEYLANFGSTFTSGSDQYTYFTSISAFNYFQNGGTSLLVTRVNSGSFSAASSSKVEALGVEGSNPGSLEPARNISGSFTQVGQGGTADTYNDIATTVSPTGGSGLTLNVTATTGSGKLIDSDTLTVTTTPAGLAAATYTDIPLPGGTGGINASASVVVASATSITSVTVTTTGSGYIAGETITLPSQSLGASSGGGTDPVLTLAASNLQVEVIDAVVSNPGTGYSVDDIVTIPGASLTGSFSDTTITLTGADIDNANVFTLETLGEGTILNSSSSLDTNGALASGSKDNIRWEIQSPNTGSGTFSLIIRRGDDNTKSKSILEIFPNVSLDPKQSNYIARIVGDMTDTLRGSGTDLYVQSTGSFRNASKYVRVKEVLLKTPDYFDNNGIAKDQYTGSIPLAQSGSFGDAIGTITAANQNYYNAINNTDSQGFDSDSISDYTDAFNLLANKDDYRFNIITAPGLVYTNATHKTPLNTLLSNIQNRGDAIVVMDLENYGSTVSATTGTAASVDNSYVSAYWPWLQLVDPDSGQLVWTPASTLIPGVYAFNDKTSEAWFAPAGINRGGLSNVVQAERKLTQTNRDDLYTGKVNPIATFPGRGVVVFGQKTLQSSASALDRVNVRRLLIELKSYISQIADNLVFEQNTAATRNNFLAQVNPYLESVQQRQGLYAFKVVMDASNNGPDVIDRNQLIGAIYIQPTKTAEFIYLDFNILPTGAVFPS
jgi:phage tail sheath protein FI